MGQHDLHPFSATAAELAGYFHGNAPRQRAENISMLLPHMGEEPVLLPSPSLRLAAELGLEIPESSELRLHKTTVETLRIPAGDAVELLPRIEAMANGGRLLLGQDARYWIAVARFTLELLGDQRFVPSLIQTNGGPLRGRWVPWLADSELTERLSLLVQSAPPVIFTAVDIAPQDRWAILESALESMIDGSVRKVLLQGRLPRGHRTT